LSYAIAAAIFSNLRLKKASRYSPSSLFAVFAPAAFYLFLKVKSEMASFLLTHGTSKKGL
jgi:hypothetical protein